MNNNYYNNKKYRRENKQKYKRGFTPEEVIFIFEKYLDNWCIMRIYNTIIQTNPNSNITAIKVRKIITGNVKLYENELTTENYIYYLELRNKVYEYNELIK